MTACQSAIIPASQDPGEAAAPILAAPSSNELNALGRRDLAAGFAGKAEVSFRSAVEQNADDLSSWLGLAASYDNLRRFDLADRAYAQALRIGGETATLLNNRGYSFLLRGDRTAAARLFRKARAIDPANPVVENNLLLLRSGERPTVAAPL